MGQMVNPFEASRILGCGPHEARTLLDGRRLTLEDVEAMALDRYSWRRHAHDHDSYWVSVGQAAGVLGVSIPRVKQLLDKGFLPYEVGIGGARLMRRAQL